MTLDALKPVGNEGTSEGLVQALEDQEKVKSARKEYSCIIHSYL